MVGAEVFPMKIVTLGCSQSGLRNHSN